MLILIYRQIAYRNIIRALVVCIFSSFGGCRETFVCVFNGIFVSVSFQYSALSTCGQPFNYLKSFKVRFRSVCINHSLCNICACVKKVFLHEELRG